MSHHKFIAFDLLRLRHFLRLGQTQSSPSLRINAGGGFYTDAAGNAWQADADYTGGATWSFQGLSITGTADPELYRDVRYSAATFGYALPAGPGAYTLKLHFVEGDASPAVGKRLFNVLVNGSVALSNFDVFAAAGGAGKALDESLPVTVPAGGGGVSVSFQTVSYAAMVSAIELIPAAPPAPSGLSAMGVNAQVSLAWSAVSGATGYSVKRATVSGGPYMTLSTPGAVIGTSYTDTGVANGTTYYYIVTATNSVGEGNASNEASATPIVAVGPTTISVTDSNLFFSPYNWYIKDSSYAQAVNNGAYIKGGFTGTSLSMNVDVSPLIAVGDAASEYPYIRFSVDNMPWTTVQLNSASTAISIAHGLAAGSHTFIIYAIGIGNHDRWTPTSVLRVSGFTLDSGATSASFSSTPLSVKSARMIAFGDSITDNVFADFDGVFAPNGDGQQDYISLVGTALGAEYGTIGFPGQGFSRSVGGTAPALPLTYGYYTSGVSRLINGLFAPAPDYIFLNEGTNDDSLPPSLVTGTIQGLRAAAPNAQIFVIVPFGGFQEAAITAGTNAVASVDAKVHLIDLGDTYFGSTSGLTGSGPSAQSSDGVHPRLYLQSELGAMVTAQVVKFLK
ncbi:MAG: hypothetical protein JO250_04515 [Armatimonadetes bacterium]|nr:hypothetical protein [Armatimonadota bacterium]